MEKVAKGTKPTYLYIMKYFVSSINNQHPIKKQNPNMYLCQCKVFVKSVVAELSISASQLLSYVGNLLANILKCISLYEINKNLAIDRVTDW